MPAGMTIESFEIQMPGALDPGLTSDNLLRPDPAGAIALVLRSPVLPDTSTMIESLDALPGFDSAWVSSAAVAEDDTDGSVFYRVEMSVLVTDDAFSGRFERPDTTTEGEG
jgi:hypothetical protein